MSMMKSKKRIAGIAAGIGLVGVVTTASMTGINTANADTPQGTLGSCCSTLTTAINNISTQIQQFFTTKLNYADVMQADSTRGIVSAKVPQLVLNSSNQAATAAMNMTATKAGKIQNELAAQVTSLQQGNGGSADTYSIATLLQTPNITSGSTQWKQAQALIQLLGGNGVPEYQLDAATLKTNTNAVKAYQAAFGSYVAYQSVGMNALYGLLQERQATSGITLPGNASPASPLELDAYTANRRLSNTWLTNIVNTATPADAQKEMLILLAEMRYEMFANRMQLEQLNATMATLNLQMLQVNKTQMNSLRRAAGAAAQNVSSSSSTGSTTGNTGSN